MQCYTGTLQVLTNLTPVTHNSKDIDFLNYANFQIRKIRPREADK